MWLLRSPICFWSLRPRLLCHSVCTCRQGSTGKQRGPPPPEATVAVAGNARRKVHPGTIGARCRLHRLIKKWSSPKHAPVVRVCPVPQKPTHLKARSSASAPLVIEACKLIGELCQRDVQSAHMPVAIASHSPGRRGGAPGRSKPAFQHAAWSSKRQSVCGALDWAFAPC